MYKIINGWTKEKMKAQIRLKNNGKRSMRIGGGCAYRGVDGNQCAAGCFIPDDKYHNRMEGKSIQFMLNTNTDPLGLRDSLPLEYPGMVSLQAEHDDYLGSSDMRDVLCQWIDRNCEDDNGTR